MGCSDPHSIQAHPPSHPLLSPQAFCGGVRGINQPLQSAVCAPGQGARTPAGWAPGHGMGTHPCRLGSWPRNGYTPMPAQRCDPCCTNTSVLCTVSRGGGLRCPSKVSTCRCHTLGEYGGGVTSLPRLQPQSREAVASSAHTRRGNWSRSCSEGAGSCKKCRPWG